MENFFKLVLAFVIGFILVLIAMPKVIPFLHKMKFGQVEREEGLESHKVKNGTPTMGGIVFVLAAIIAMIVVNIGGLFNPELILATIVLVGYSLIGFVDDALIIVKHSNKGLSPLAKLLAQIALAIICYIFAINFIPDFTSIVTIPVIKVDIDFGILYPLLILIMFAGESNGVNLSDGLDGLATGLSMVAIAPFIIFAIMTKDYALASYATAMVGALLGFMMFNYHPAKIFMGDVGSLGLGGFLAILAILTKQELLLILVGGVFLMETLSVIIQVVSFKTRGKRVFKMAPIHHHFEMLGWSEQQVTISFWFIGFICGILSIVIGVL
ncbi:phospho-N-acetylmuramoyl-pentapeptide-transferase [Thomasclavelia sp.]|uniref:phospho-N-acetylmuramoyl-pentapeptide- transferase n=1 Tax=Thomasclavelia sp. TaxID=3025757 RepID=UPI0025EA928C|nr:phospho-N-acetylmuramoyl-pentapeptide-transferase [Thomasclavelia sp.]